MSPADALSPGIFIVLALRFDRRHLTDSGHHAYRKPYFIATTVGYVVGLLTTFGVMFTFRAAQVGGRASPGGAFEWAQRHI